MSSSVVSPEDVLETLMNDGTIDAIRLKIINQLKANEELRSTTVSMVEQSKVLNTPGAEKQTKRELFDALRQELETPVLEKASKAVWQLILDNNGLGKEISETVAKTFFRLSGQEPPQSLQTKGDVQVKDTENLNRQQRKEKEKGDVQVQDVDNSIRQHRKEKEKVDVQVQDAENSNRHQRKEKEKGDVPVHDAENFNRHQRKEKEKGDAQVYHAESINSKLRKEREKGDVQLHHTETISRQKRKEKEKSDVQVHHYENSNRPQRREREGEKASPGSSSRKRTHDGMKYKESDMLREASVASDDSERGIQRERCKI